MVEGTTMTGIDTTIRDNIFLRLQTDPPTTVADMASAVKETLPTITRDAFTKGPGELNQASAQLKKLAMANLQQAQRFEDQIGASTDKGGLAHEFSVSVQRAAFALCAAGAIDGVNAHVAGLVPSSFSVSSRFTPGVNEIASHLQATASELLDYVDSDPSVAQSRTKVSYHAQQTTALLAEAEPCPNSARVSTYGSRTMQPAVKSAYELGTELGILASLEARQPAAHLSRI